ncbi:MAG: hypothetical protein RIG62_30205 [Cyclobacteriaceae bacterium]
MLYQNSGKTQCDHAGLFDNVLAIYAFPMSFSENAATDSLIALLVRNQQKVK